MKISRRVGKTRKVALPRIKGDEALAESLMMRMAARDELDITSIPELDYGPDDIGLRAPTDSYFIASQDGRLR